MRQKIIATILVVCLMLVWIPAASADDSVYTIVRVKLSMGTPTSMAVLLDGNYSVKGNDSIALKKDTYTVKLASGKINLFDGSDVVYSGDSLTFIQHAATSGQNNWMCLNNSKYGNTYYLGDMEFLPDSSGSYIVVINKVFIEDYLCGVLPYEMSDLWPLEALKTQAVCARNYVENHMGGSGLYDVVDTSSDQVYRGFNPSNKNSIQAVNTTAGTVITCGGKLAEVYFSASNGGYTEIPQHVWSASAPILPYHVIQEDPYDAANSYSSQEVLTFPKKISDSDKIKYQYSSGGKMVDGSGNESANIQNYLLSSALKAVADKGYTAKSASDISIAGINSITPFSYEDQHDIKDYNGNDGCVCYNKATVNMTVLAKKLVPDAGLNLGDVNNDGVINIGDYTYIRLGILGLRGLSDNEKTAADVDQDGNVNIADYTLIRLSILGLKSLGNQSTGTYIQEPVTVEFTIDLHELDKAGGQYQSFDNTSLRLFVVTQTDTSWNIYQRRYGHGIGMSQRGAEQRARSSDTNVNTYEKILAFYYPNTNLAVQNYSRPELTPLA